MLPLLLCRSDLSCCPSPGAALDELEASAYRSLLEFRSAAEAAADVEVRFEDVLGVTVGGTPRWWSPGAMTGYPGGAAAVVGEEEGLELFGARLVIGAEVGPLPVGE